jgi:hypothetical protein
MIKVLSDKDENVVEMRNMKPMQIGKILPTEPYAGDIVMRTQSTDTFEVMNLTNYADNTCWTHKPTIKVRLYTKPKTIIVSNEGV